MEESKIETHNEGESKNLQLSAKEKKGRVFIKNLPFKLNEEDFKKKFETFGEVLEVNIPKKEDGKLKGFAFVQFKQKKDALSAIKELQGTKIDGRPIHLDLALSKEEYLTNAKEVKQEETVEEKPKRNLLNDPERTIFVRNLGFNTDEGKLKEFFQSYGHVIYAKIVKNRETNASKGTGFVMFKTREECEEVLKLYHKYSQNPNRKDNEDTLNPFELDGRNIKLFPSVTKEEAVNLEKEGQKLDMTDKRNRKILYYGLSQSSFKNFKNQEASEEDMMKREKLITLKKTNFRKNPNFHVSSTRLSIRNLEKNIDEERIKNLINEKLGEHLKENKDIEKTYAKIKKIKQIKLLRDKNIAGKDGLAKSKCVAFVECCDFTVARTLVDILSNLKLSKNGKKGLIVDFAMDDYRKIVQREKKLDKIKEMKKQKKAEDAEKKKQAEVQDKESSKNSIENINDIDQLLQIYAKCISRGKKQRIKKKLRSLGYNKPLDMKVETKVEVVKQSKKENYTTTKIETNNTNINKKIKENNKKNKQQDKMLNNKRKRNHKGKNEDYEEEEGMGEYFQQIMKNLNKTNNK